MFPSFLITFRETLEAALVVGIVLGYLVKTRQTQYNKYVYGGAAAGIMGSVIVAALFVIVSGGFEGTAEQIFEGVTMLVGATLLTTMILWMMKQRSIAHKLEQRVALQLEDAHKFGLFSLVFVAVLREGIETVLFLGATSFVAVGNSTLGAAIGIVASLVLGYAIFVGSLRINLRKFFLVTGILLILFAAGLVAHGIHELGEAGLVPAVIQEVWDLNPPQHADGSYPLLHENGAIGSVLKGLFGYNGNPSLAEIIAYIAYLGIIVVAWKWVERGKKIVQPSAL